MRLGIETPLTLARFGGSHWTEKIELFSVVLADVNRNGDPKYAMQVLSHLTEFY